jgi:arylsulfatase A-like enzyme
MKMCRQILWIILGILFNIQCHATEKPNIIYILSDDQGWRDVGFMGDEFYETPNLDQMTREGLTFTRAYSSGPNCAPTRACLISGMYTPRHQIYNPGGKAKGDVSKMKMWVPVQERFLNPNQIPEKEPFVTKEELDGEIISIAEVLKEAGYITAHFGKWHLGSDKQGFEFNTTIETPKELGSIHYRDTLSAPKLTETSINFIRKNKDKNFFLYLAHWEVHIPLVATKDLIKKYEKKIANVTPENGYNYNAKYCAMVEQLDNSVGAILETLKEEGIDENTLVIFMSDNGGVTRHSLIAPLRGGKGSLYEGGIRVPGCARWPAVIKPNTKTSTPVTSVDMMPTFAELAEAPLPTNQPVDGVSIVPVLKGKRVEKLNNRAIFWHFPLYLTGGGDKTYIPLTADGKAGQGKGWRAIPGSSMIKGDWKVINYYEKEDVELYNIKNDEEETTNLAKKYPKKAKELNKLLEEWRISTNANGPTLRNPFYVEK